eukprot:562142-Pelagomonas_calceolata.AAC.2
MIQGMGNIDSPAHNQEECVESGLKILECLHSSLCCCCEASSWTPGLVSSQYLAKPNWLASQTKNPHDIR